MKKVDIGQTIQIIANIGVIAGIFFVGFELQQNTVAVKSEASNGIQENVVANYEILMSDSMMDIYQRGMINPADLTALETGKFHSFWTVSLLAYQNLYYQVLEGAYDGQRVEGWWQHLRSQFEYSGVKEHWTSRSFILSAEFRDFVETNVMSREPTTELLVLPRRE